MRLVNPYRRIVEVPTYIQLNDTTQIKLKTSELLTNKITTHYRTYLCIVFLKIRHTRPTSHSKLSINKPENRDRSSPLYSTYKLPLTRRCIAARPRIVPTTAEHGYQIIVLTSELHTLPQFQFNRIGSVSESIY